MDEKKIQKRLKKTIIFVAATGVILLAAAGFFGWFLWHSVDQAVNEQMSAETDEYIKRLYKQMHANFQLLDTLSSFVADAEIQEKAEFPELLDEANHQNDFITMGYFDESGDGVTVTLDEGIEMTTIEACQEEFKEVAYAALDGKRSVSRLFMGGISHEKVVVYAVPVMRDNEVIGALCASDHIEIFTDILTGNQVMGGSAYIHMVNQDGDFLIRSERAAVQEESETLFGEPYLNPDQYSDIEEKLHAGEEARFSFEYNGESYRTLLEPVGINGWYLFCVNSVQESSAIVYFIVRVVAGIFIAVLFLFMFWLLYSYRLMKKNAGDLYHLAFYDQMTEAYNFPRFRQIAEEKSKRDRNGALISLNIHQFKFINEIFGKEQADRLLRHTSDVLSRSLKEGEIFCRESADFFYIFLKSTDKNEILQRMERIMAEVSEHKNEDQSGYHILLYCGAVISDEAQTTYTLEQMMTHVMFALEKARETHQNNVWFFDSKLHEKELMDNYVEGHMYQALENGEFSLYLQMKTDLRTGKTAGAEALVRWSRENGGMIYPDQFIPVFESNGFCTKLDIYMVDKVCSCIRDWIDRGLEPLPVSVNQSKAVLYKTDYIEKLCAIIQHYGIPAELITLEILEGAALENAEEFNCTICALQSEGFQISMDDFGSGYSSLNVLGKLQINEVKLDRGFLNEVTEGKNEKARLIMEQIVELSKKLRIRTVVEGVETEESDRMIREWGCDLGQGYYYGRPVSAEEFTEKYMK
ncbi:EAL domain-containing protein [[Ruminococcus] torques]|uniref:bifunctional diguanylate cyclase/phosphodiesterase n=1 Tax=[Ruminococcus] torques TaxID=33039 RepID=UPI0025A38C59|nr:EAL domain-containing protein [[Ruminococcus] torques]MDM8236855.1 EAL domain-containing protein [[Ruminococcus] torques]